MRGARTRAHTCVAYKSLARRAISPCEGVGKRGRERRSFAALAAQQQKKGDERNRVEMIIAAAHIGRLGGKLLVAPDWSYFPSHPGGF